MGQRRREPLGLLYESSLLWGKGSLLLENEKARQINHPSNNSIGCGVGEMKLVGYQGNFGVYD